MSLTPSVPEGKEFELKIGNSFRQSAKNPSSFHTLRYDFKPASIDTNKPSVVEVKKNNECSVTLPHVQDGGSTIYKGSKRPATKECILIYDKVTGEFTLEKISSSILLKKSRVEKKKPAINPAPTSVATSSNTTSTATAAATQSKPPPASQQHPGSKLSAASQHRPITPSITPSLDPPAAPSAPAALPASQQKQLAASTDQPKRHQKASFSSRGSDSESSSGSDSSDSETENEFSAQPSTGGLNSATTSGRMLTPPPQPAPPQRSFSTLHSDLQLSDSNSDSD